MYLLKAIRIYPAYFIWNIVWYRFFVFIRLHFDLITVLLLFAFEDVEVRNLLFFLQRVKSTDLLRLSWSREIERMNICFCAKWKGLKPICICLQDHSRLRNDSDKCIWCSDKCFNCSRFYFYMHSIFLHAHARYLKGCSLLTYFPHTYVTSIDDHSFEHSLSK